MMFIALLKALLRKQTPSAPNLMDEFVRQHKIVFFWPGKTSVEGSDICDFNYLLGGLTGGKVRRLDDFQFVSNQKPLIDKSIADDLQRKVLWESGRYNYNREIAEGNVRQLQRIVNSISGYVALCDQLGMGVQPGEVTSSMLHGAT